MNKYVTWTTGTGVVFEIKNIQERQTKTDKKKIGKVFSRVARASSLEKVALVVS